jgi:hypothetical protein
MHGAAIAGDALRSTAAAFADGPAAPDATTADALGIGAVSAIGRAHPLASHTTQTPVTTVPETRKGRMAQ